MRCHRPATPESELGCGTGLAQWEELSALHQVEGCALPKRRPCAWLWASEAMWAARGPLPGSKPFCADPGVQGLCLRGLALSLCLRGLALRLCPGKAATVCPAQAWASTVISLPLGHDKVGM